MKMPIHPDMIEATRLTQAGRITEATALLQRLMFWGGLQTGDARTPVDASGNGELRTKRGGSGMSDARDGEPVGTPGDVRPQPRILRALRAVVNGIGRMGGQARRAGGKAPVPAEGDGEAVPAGGRFLTASYTGHAGSRAYKLYIPGGYRGRPLPLIVMLHGCTQSADDFAVGTRMNAVAEAHACLVAYPMQPQSANGSKCWNWFSPHNQQRGRGEPSIVAGIAGQIMHDFAVDRRRVYVAGLSAGGAAAAVLGTIYPDIFAAVGVHSGLAHGAAKNAHGAFAAMRHGQAAVTELPPFQQGLGGDRATVPTIVFHGDDDRTVHPRNADQVIEQLLSRGTGELRATTRQGQVADGRSYTRTYYLDAKGRAVHEMWAVHDAGHAWSGGSPEGTYTDPHGPDASREMLRFFLEHPHTEAAVSKR